MRSRQDRAASVDQFGNETETWGWMQNVNLQVAKLAPTLLKLTSDRAYHFGEVPNDSTGPDKDSLIETINGPMLAATSPTRTAPATFLSSIRT